MQTYFLNDFKVNIPKYILPGTDEYLDPANVDFEVRLFVPPSAGAFVASHIGGEYVNCKVADGQICIIADGHQLAPGEVWYEAKYHLPDSDYPDGYCTLVEKSSLGLSLTTSADVEVREEQEASVAEQLREQAEANRVTAETAREQAETSRVAAEADRQTAEQAREQAEQAREQAESQRAETFAGWREAIDAKADRTELSNIVGTPSEGVIEDLEPTLVTEALRKTAQTLTPAEQVQVKKNIGVSKMELFIDMWNARCTIRGRSYGGYDPENAPDPSTPFKLNDIWLSYADAIAVMNVPPLYPYSGPGFFVDNSTRTYFPILVLNYTIEQVGLYNKSLEVVRFLSQSMVRYGADPDTGFINCYYTTGAFSQCPALREVKGILKLKANDNQNKHFHTGLENCGNLETIWLYNVSLNMNLGSCPKIKAECFRYMVEHAANTKAITITVHKDVFAKLTDEANTEWNQVLTDATNKNITFATL